ncbi:MAG: PAS domain S-box protein, partial [Anaerolineaceae bacterium]|nr:PAS domain S-box protein [Anaerolineaceae bacterium]
KYEYVSHASTLIFGYSPEKWYENPLLIREILHPEFHLYFDKQFENIFKGQVPTTYEYKIIHKNRTERWINQRNKLIRDDNGNIVAMEGVVTDITERKMKEALRESEEKLRLLFDHSPVGICTVDLLGNFVTTNPAYEQMLGYSKEELSYLSFFDVTHPDYRPKNKALFQNMFSLESTGFKIEKKYICNNGDEIDVSVHATAVIDDKGKMIFGTAFVEDITEHRNAEKEQEKLQAQFIQAQKMESVGRLAGGVAHDYNNISSIIIGYSELALEKVDQGDSLHEDLMEIFTAAKRSTEITRQLLAFARQQTIAPMVLDLNKTIGNMLKMLRRLIGEDINLAFLPGDELWPIKIDPSQVDQILANLCVNARDAIADVGKITIETKNITFDEDYCAIHAGFNPGEYVMLIVSDNGSGIAPKILDKIFEPFFTTKKLGKGTGLGLSTVYGIVKQNVGFINIYSEPKQGTAIKIYLPRNEGLVVKSHSENTIEVPLSQGERVLLVEDDGAILKLGKKILEELGYAVLSFASPMEATKLGEEQVREIDLLITDVVMPGMNGRELSEYLQHFYPNVIAHRGVLEDGVSFISKPFSKKDLAAKVRSVLDEGKE